MVDIRNDDTVRVPLGLTRMVPFGVTVLAPSTIAASLSVPVTLPAEERPNDSTVVLSFVASPQTNAAFDVVRRTRK